MDKDTGETAAGELGAKYSNMNANNYISDRDINISLNLDDPVQTSPQVFHEEDSHVRGEDTNLQQKEAERQEWLTNLQKEKLQWEALESMQHSSTGSMKVTPLISFNEVLQHFQTKNLDASKIRPTISRTGLAALIHFLFGPPRLHPSLVEERDLIFCVAQTQLDDHEDIHNKVLQTIYKKLTGSKFDCPRRGSHWETIGFQGNDPATDLRGIGFLGLIHLLHGVMDPTVCNLFAEMYRLSLDEEQNFPFCVMSLNVTRITLQVLREEKLCRDCNRRKQVIAVLNDFFIAVFFQIYTVWKSQFKTMKDSGHVIKDVEKQAKKNPKTLLRNLETTLKNKQMQTHPVTPIPTAALQVPDLSAHLKRTVSAASSASVASEPRNSVEPSFTTGTPNSSRIAPKKKTSEGSLQEFTDIQLEAKEEQVTDL